MVQIIFFWSKRDWNGPDFANLDLKKSNLATLFETTEVKVSLFRSLSPHIFSPWRVTTQPRSTQPPVAPAASRLQYGRRRNTNALPKRGHIVRIEPILAIISVEIL